MVLKQHMTLCGERKHVVKWINYVSQPQKKKKVKLCRILNTELYAKVKTGNHSSVEFKVTKGLRQGDPVVPSLFNIVLEPAIKSSEVETWGTIFDKHSQIMAYADDVVIMGKDQKMLNKY
jgi:hypothetical protein